MEQMVYENILLRERFILESGQYMGYNFWIISYGTHPCAYVELPQTHPYFGKCNSDAYELNIDVHGGITYGDFGLGNIVDDKKFLLGWDYNHCTDYNPMTNALFEEPLKRWTTEEILEEVKDVIKQLHIAGVSKTLTDKWKKGELANGTYYVRLNHDSSTIDVYDCGVWWSDAWHEITEVLEEVPNFEEYQKLLSDQLAKNEGVEINAELEAEKTKLKKWCEEFNALDVAKENTKLKELLKRAKEVLEDEGDYMIVQEINQALGTDR